MTIQQPVFMYPLIKYKWDGFIPLVEHADFLKILMQYNLHSSDVSWRTQCFMEISKSVSIKGRGTFDFLQTMLWSIWDASAHAHTHTDRTHTHTHKHTPTSLHARDLVGNTGGICESNCRSSNSTTTAILKHGWGRYLHVCAQRRAEMRLLCKWWSLPSQPHSRAGLLWGRPSH